MTDTRDFAACNPGGFTFGLTNASVAAGLRKLADDVEAGKFAVLEVKLEQSTPMEDFTTGVWTLRFQAAEKRDVPEPNQHAR